MVKHPLRFKLFLAGFVLLALVACGGDRAEPGLTVEHSGAVGEILRSPRADGAQGRVLNGSSVRGTVYLHAASGKATEARFYLDDPAGAGEPFQTLEKGKGAAVLDSSRLSDGMHTLTLVLDKKGGDKSYTATFLVDNGAELTGQLLVSRTPDRADAALLTGSSLDGEVYVFIVPETAPEQVAFYLNDPERKSRPERVEYLTYYDLAATAPDGAARPFDASALGAGEHTVTAVVTGTGQSEAVSARFSVPGGEPEPQPDPEPRPEPESLPQPDPVPGKAPVETVNGFKPTLLTNYYALEPGGPGGKPVPSYHGLTYRPYNPSAWDRLEVAQDAQKTSRKNWLHLNLNRDARVAVLWRGGSPPSWLGGWQEVEAKAEDVRRFEKAFEQTQTVVLGGNEGRGSYEVLLGEAGGAAPAPPPLPGGISERPQPNKACPTWVHDQYVATHPDDKRVYRTWHPSIDPVYWCYFGHEHGSDPSLVGYTPYFDYTAEKNNSQREQHEGFKGFAFQEKAGAKTTNWYLNIHATTGLKMRACARFHTVVIAAADAQGRPLAELSFKGDFGEARANLGDKALITNTECPQKPIEALGTSAERQFRILNEKGYEDGAYEIWSFASNPFLGVEIGLDRSVGIDILNPITGCDGLRCEDFVLTETARLPQESSASSRGDVRVMGFGGELALRYDEARDLSDGKKDGYFYTDPEGTKFLEAGHPNAVRQFIGEDVSMSLTSSYGFFANYDAWRGLYLHNGRHSGIGGFKLESSIDLLN